MAKEMLQFNFQTYIVISYLYHWSLLGKWASRENLLHSTRIWKHLKYINSDRNKIVNLCHYCSPWQQQLGNYLSKKYYWFIKFNHCSVLQSNFSLILETFDFSPQGWPLFNIHLFFFLTFCCIITLISGIINHYGKINKKWENIWKN